MMSFATKATELHKSNPATYPTVDVAFAKVYSDPKHRALVAAERSENRPGLTVEVEKDGDRSVIGERVTRLATALGRTHRGMTHDECVDAVLRANPDLRRAWEREQEQAPWGFRFFPGRSLILLRASF
jgi:hypothetical protein